MMNNLLGMLPNMLFASESLPAGYDVDACDWSRKTTVTGRKITAGRLGDDWVITNFCHIIHKRNLLVKSCISDQNSIDFARCLQANLSLRLASVEAVVAWLHLFRPNILFTRLLSKSTLSKLLLKLEKSRIIDKVHSNFGRLWPPPLCVAYKKASVLVDHRITRVETTNNDKSIR